MTLCDLTLSSLQFIDNIATEKGGAIYYDYARPTFNSSILFQNNTAQYGNDIASYAVKITLANDTTTTMNLRDVGSGIANPEPLEFAVRDYDNQVMNLNSQDQIIMSAVDSSTTQVKGYNAAILTNGVTRFDNLIVVAEPGSQNIEIITFSKAIDKHKITEIPEITINFSTVKISVRN